MKRDYANTEVQQLTASFFYGIEVEHTPAKGMLTMFVVGLHEPESVLHQITNLGLNIKHVYFGANQSFKADSNKDWAAWTKMVRGVLTRGMWATLDVEPTEITNFLETGLCEYRKFIPMISVKLPYIEQLNYNATIKIDDVGFEATNPGVWCHRVHDLKATEKFTNWDCYTEDKLLK